MVSGVKESLGKRKMKNHLFLKVGVGWNALTSVETLIFIYIKKNVIVCFASYYAEGESMA